MRQRDIDPFARPAFDRRYLAIKSVWVGYAERALGAVDLYVRQMIPPDIITHDNRSDGAVLEFERAGDMRVDLDRQNLAPKRFTGSDALAGRSSAPARRLARPDPSN